MLPTSMVANVRNSRRAFSFNRIHQHGLHITMAPAMHIVRKTLSLQVRRSLVQKTMRVLYQQRTLCTAYLSISLSAEPSLLTFVMGRVKTKIVRCSEVTHVH